LTGLDGRRDAYRVRSVASALATKVLLQFDDIRRRPAGIKRNKGPGRGRVVLCRLLFPLLPTGFTGSTAFAVNPRFALS
jgi:hypothetical protein